jgi:hypothetical protein
MLGMGWYLDYLLSTAIRRIKERRSCGWPIARGTVYTSTSSGLTAQVVYTYIANGERHTGEHTRSFWFTDSARTYAELFAPRTTVTIRYSARQAETSIMRSQDQGKRGTQLDGL